MYFQQPENHLPLVQSLPWKGINQKTWHPDPKACKESTDKREKRNMRERDRKERKRKREERERERERVREMEKSTVKWSRHGKYPSDPLKKRVRLYQETKAIKG